MHTNDIPLKQNVINYMLSHCIFSMSSMYYCLENIDLHAFSLDTIEKEHLSNLILKINCDLK